IPAEGGTLAQLKFTGRYVNSLGQKDIYNQVVIVNIPPTVGVTFSLANLVKGKQAFYCEDQSLISVDGAPRPAEGFSLGSFTVNSQTFATVSGYFDNGNGTGKITPSTMGATKYNSQKVRYTFKSLLTGCQSYFDSTLYIAPKPVADFAFGTARCVGQPVDLNGQYTFNASVPPALTDSVQFAWSFNDPQGNAVTNTSVLKNAQHIYTSPNNVGPSLLVTSKHTCVSDPVTKTFQIGAIPVPIFSFSGLSGVGTDFLVFNNASTLYSAPSSNSQIDYIRYNFGDGAVQKITSGFGAPKNHTFPHSGVYNVSLQVHSDFGCIDSIRQRVVVLARTSITQENFEGVTDWLTYSYKTNSSWQVAQTISNKSAIHFDPLINDSKIWVTSANGPYVSNETSALYSPVYDLTVFNEPVVSFDNFTNIANSDGVVLQYSLDNKNVGDTTKVWTTLGIYDPVNPSGIGWYNSLTLPSYPGGIAGNPAAYAWTGTNSSAWYQSKHSLTLIKTYNKVVFRFALGSVTANPSTDGFAMDNFRVGERNRIALVEDVTSTNTKNPAGEGVRIKKVTDKITTMVQSGISMVAINYHVDYNESEPFNLDGQADPSSRELFYSATSVPYTFVDGYTDPLKRDFDLWGDATVQLRLLDAPRLAINLLNVHNTDSGSLKIDRIDLHSTGYIDNAVLFVAIIENNIDITNPKLDKTFIKTAETKFNYVLKKFLPSAAGTTLASMVPGSNYSVKNLKWSPDAKKVYTNNFNVVAFVQDARTKEVLQAVISAPMAVTNNKLVTGLELAESGLSVYPNPANREIHMQRKFRSTQDMTVRLINQVGEVVMEKIMKMEELNSLINVEGLAAGIYIIQAGDAVRKKIIVMH
ncbi:MAG TPA: PKD domain-containing protein, partial [Cyclobacteriaceae bacterium]|nr:PKD domain-containing protein [Cyclobacteriaceae bacterium]